MRFLALLIGCLPAVTFADEVLNEQPNANEVGRFHVTHLLDVTLKLDSRTGQSWLLCQGKKSKQAWCKVKDGGRLPAGPVGRYKLAENTVPLMMFDTVSGRSFVRCEDPTPDKSFSWCPLED